MPSGFDSADRDVFVFFPVNRFQPSASAIDADSAAKIASEICHFTLRSLPRLRLHTAMTKEDGH